MHTQTLAQLSAALHRRDLTSVELTEYFLARIQQYDATLNSVVTVTPEQALAQAKAADARLDRGDADPLTGIPILYKDIFCTAGVKTACGSKMLDNFISPYNATLVERCQHAGMVMLGKTNMDEFAMGSSNENSYYGPVKNPWDTDRTPGGSSGGSAAAVAARLAPISIGTDTGGSIRQPAALCGITGLKPTYGRVSRYGMIAFASSCDQAGPMSQTAEDAAYLLKTIAGHDPRDSTCVDQPVDDYVAALTQPIKGLRIGLPEEYFTADLNPEMNTRLQAAIALLTDMGMTFKPVRLPHSKLAMVIYYIIAPAEASSNLARYDGVRYGYRCDSPTDLRDLYRRSRSEAFGEEVKRRILIGTYVLSSGYYDAYYKKAQQVRRLIYDDFMTAFNSVDLILAPTTNTTAFKLGEKKDPVQMYLSDYYTVAVNMPGLPALSIPAGFVDDLPVGLQLIGPHFSEAKLLSVAHQYQQQTNWHQHIPASVNPDTPRQR